MKVRWTNTAIHHLLAIHEFAAQNSKRYADRLVDRLTRKSEQIAVFPKSGRAVPEYSREDIREILDHPYRIIYRK